MIPTRANMPFKNQTTNDKATIPFEQLRQLSIPIYMVAASQDNSSPIYGLDYIRLEFLRLGKTNLVYDTCVGCNHYLVNADSGQSTGTNYIDRILSWVAGK